MPEGLGGFQHFEPLLDRLCQPCNRAIGDNAEREFFRQGPEGLLRSMNWVQRGGKKKKQPRNSVLFERTDTETGYCLLGMPCEQPSSFRAISQVLILDPNKKQIGRAVISPGISTGQELEQLLKEQGFTNQALHVTAASGDEDRIRRLFSDCGATVQLTEGKKEVPGKLTFTTQVRPAYFRALAKIGFHYALKYIPSITGNEACFKPLREFIRDGVGEPNQFLRHGDFDSSSNFFGHIITAVASPAEISIRMAFYVGTKVSLKQWCLRMPNPLQVQTISAHRFLYNKNNEGWWVGGKIENFSQEAAQMIAATQGQ